MTAGVLLDTHAVIWWLLDDPRLSPAAYALVEDPGNAIAASSVSVWEVAIKTGLGKMKAPRDLPGRLEDEGFKPLPVTAEHAWAVRDLPPHHTDPFDRLLVAQAKVEGLAIVSADRHLDAYGVERLW